ncbi:hypothetical protein [Lysinibacillus sp. NPDC086135]|uniref:hypothetical protein n=1 Tax=Lysinibacillus sp. NPDC086135 TaxID=3364130 RepID=UPI0038192ACC
MMVVQYNDLTKMEDPCGLTKAMSTKARNSYTILVFFALLIVALLFVLKFIGGGR